MLPIPFLLFATPFSIFINTMCIITIVASGYLSLSEIKGTHLQYSKFWNANEAKTTPLARIKLSGKAGMLLFYSPAFVAALSSFWIYPVTDLDLRFLLICSALAVHFFKRIFEVLFIHKYSSNMVLESAVFVSLSYSVSTATLIYSQYLTKDSRQPSVDLKYAGVAAFLIGISGNMYHHILLSKLRENGCKEYKIPRGGLFKMVICPHYFFEIIGFMGVSFISQTRYAVSFAIGSMFYLVGRSYGTRKWYLSKFEDFPEKVKCLIPYVY